jgi:tRNA (guanine-N7-)-methyltransferase
MRPIRSFVRRGGRITAAQARALEELWPLFGIEFSPAPLDLNTAFRRCAARVLEIGFGNGDALLARAAQEPQRDFLGIEVHEPGVGRVLQGAQTQALKNLRVICHDAVEVLARQIDDAAFDEILIFFPDPWPKKRHHKRRLIQPEFSTLLARKLKPGGSLRLATDWQSYAEQMLEVLNDCKDLANCAPHAGFIDRPESRPPTRFECRGRRLGHGVWDLEYRKLILHS